MRWLMRTLIGLAVVIAAFAALVSMQQSQGNVRRTGTGLVKLNAVAEAK